MPIKHKTNIHMEIEENLRSMPDRNAKESVQNKWKEGCTKMKEAIRHNGTITVLGLRF
jgi:hypothetical protein